MIDLQPFCSTDNLRENISRPWRVGEWACATNAAIMVRVHHEQACPFEPPPGSQPDIEKVLGLNRPVAGYLPLADYFTRTAIETEPCSTCNGTQKLDCDNCNGTGKVECSECGGTGTVTCEYDHEHQCPECENGEPTDCECGGQDFPCDRCDDGTQPKVMAVNMPEGVFNAQFLNLMLDLPDCRIGIRPIINPTLGMYFTFDGGEGVVMPLRQLGDMPAIDALHAKALEMLEAKP